MYEISLIAKILLIAMLAIVVWSIVKLGFFKTLGITILFNVVYFILTLILGLKTNEELLVFGIIGTIAYFVLLVMLIKRKPDIKHVKEIREIREIIVNDENKKNISTDSEIKKD